MSYLKMLPWLGAFVVFSAMTLWAGEITLVKDGQPQATIITCENPINPESYAAKELQKYIMKASFNSGPWHAVVALRMPSEIRRSAQRIEHAPPHHSHPLLRGTMVRHRATSDS